MRLRSRVERAIKHLAGQHNQLDHDPTPDYDATPEAPKQNIPSQEAPKESTTPSKPSSPPIEKASKYYDVVTRTNTLEGAFEWQDAFKKAENDFRSYSRDSVQETLGFVPKEEDFELLQESMAVQAAALRNMINDSGGSIEFDYIESRRQAQKEIDRVVKRRDESYAELEELREKLKVAEEKHTEFYDDDKLEAKYQSIIDDFKEEIEMYEGWNAEYDSEIEGLEAELENIESDYDNDQYSVDDDNDQQTIVVSHHGKNGALEGFAYFTNEPEPGKEWEMSYMAVAPWNNSNFSRLRNEATGKRENADRKMEDYFGRKKNPNASLDVALKVVKAAVLSNSPLRFVPATDQVKRLYLFLGAKSENDSIDALGAMTWDVDSMKKFIYNNDKDWLK
jgi:hypothetical protein